MKAIEWMGSSLDDLRAFPEQARIVMGKALFAVQHGQKPMNAVPMRGLGSGVLEIRDDFDKDTYRVVYVAKLSRKVYVLHSFKKKSKTGVETPKHDIDIIKQRYKDALRIDAGGEP